MSRGRRLSILGIAAGAVAIAAGLVAGRPVVVLGSITAMFLYSAGLATGGVAVLAAVRVVNARWADPALPAGRALASFFVPAFLLLIVVVASAPAWMPPGTDAHRAGAFVSMILRQIVGTAVLLFAGRWFLRTASGTSAVVYLILYAAVLSMWAIDFIVGIRTDWIASSVTPAGYFMGSFLGGIAWLGLIGTRGPEVAPLDTRHDISNLIFAFSAFWGYLLWSAFLPTWYGNVPGEMAQLIARWTGGWRAVTSLALLAIFAVPFFLLFPERARGQRTTLAVGSALVLVGLLVERFLLVIPSLTVEIGIGSALICAGVALGALGLLAIIVAGRAPVPTE